MRPQFFLPLLALVACYRSPESPYFINPPPFVTTNDFSTNIVLLQGDFQIVQWAGVTNPNKSRISVAMSQLDGTVVFGDLEYPVANATWDTTSANWVVNTKKHLSISPMFYFSLFFEGETSPMAPMVYSHYFNITAKSTTTSTTTTSSSTTSPTPSSTTSSSIASASQTSIPASSGLSAGAKAGIAIGVAGAMLLGVLASWLILGRRAKVNNVRTSYYEPVKVDHQLQQYPQEINAEPTVRPQEVSVEPVARYELPSVGRPQH
ncbi:hypothetical protein BGZ57DRAFT_982118 [Hyaloscypha finlandica]|nr:hypothetical protein BGZ57DRAFT_982118 [Hyaloscypha finlandica]